MNVLKRLTDLYKIIVDKPVQDTQRFLDVLKDLGCIADVRFFADHLFDRLPEHCAVKYLIMSSAPSDLGFLFRLESLIYIELKFSIDYKFVRKGFEELNFLFQFEFRHIDNQVAIRFDQQKRLQVCLELTFFGDNKEWVNCSDLNAAIEFISKTPPKKRMSEDLLDSSSSD